MSRALASATHDFHKSEEKSVAKHIFLSRFHDPPSVVELLKILRTQKTISQIDKLSGLFHLNVQIAVRSKKGQQLFFKIGPKNRCV